MGSRAVIGEQQPSVREVLVKGAVMFGIVVVGLIASIVRLG